MVQHNAEPYRNGGMIVCVVDCFRNQVNVFLLKYLIYCTNPSFDVVIFDSSEMLKL